MSFSQPSSRPLPKVYTELDYLLNLANVPSEEDRRHVLLRQKRLVQTVHDLGISPKVFSRFLFATLLLIACGIVLVPKYPELTETIFITSEIAVFVLLYTLFGGLIVFIFFANDLLEPTSVRKHALEVDETALMYLPPSWSKSIVSLQEESEKVMDIYFEVEQWLSLGYVLLMVCDTDGHRRCIDYQEFGELKPISG